MTHVFFDLDKTLITVQSQSLLLKTLNKYGYISSWQFFKLRMFFLMYKLGLLSRKSIVSTFETVASLFKGVEVSVVESRVRAFVFAYFSEVQNLRAMEELEKHISAGREIVLTSSAFEPIVKYAAEYFHIPHYCCTKLEIQDGKYTGKLDGKPNYGEEKLKKLEVFDFTGSHAYADHDSDIPLLLKATYRYAVNPTRKMRAYAKDHGWFIIE